MDYLIPEWPAPPQIKAYTTTRQLWIRDQGDDENLKKIKNTLNLPDEPIWLNQIHSANVIEALPTPIKPEADASFTTLPNRVCAVLTADCLPLLICNKQGNLAAAIHGGWRGLAAGIIETTLNSLNQASDNLLVWLGPAIGPQKFEVGVDVYQSFTQEQCETASAFIAQENGKWLANLYQLAKIQLELLGVNHIYGGGFCTHSQQDLFFSYRRDHGKTGRMVSLIWIDKL